MEVDDARPQENIGLALLLAALLFGGLGLSEAVQEQICGQEAA